MPIDAESIALWTTGTSSRAMTTRIQKQLNNMAKFLSANGFKISASKSQAVLFTNNSVKRSGPIPDSVSAKKLSHSQMATFLGIVLDAKLNWSAHTEAIKTRYMKRLNAVRAISGSPWGANKSNLLQVYRATIRPLLDYGCEAIDMKCKQITEVYNKIHYQTLKICCGGMKGTSEILSTYVIRNSWQTMPSGQPPRKICLLKINILFLMANLKRCSTSG